MTQNGFWHQHSLINLKKIKNRIKKNEGYINTPYYDQLSYRTIGYGHLIKKNADQNQKKENVVDADFEEVKEDKNDKDKEKSA